MYFKINLIINIHTALIQLLSSNTLGRSVDISMANISTAWFSRPCLFTKSSLAIIAAPEPSLVGLKTHRIIFTCITRLSFTGNNFNFTVVNML